MACSIRDSDEAKSLQATLELLQSAKEVTKFVINTEILVECCHYQVTCLIINRNWCQISVLLKRNNVLWRSFTEEVQKHFCSQNLTVD